MSDNGRMNAGLLAVMLFLSAMMPLTGLELRLTEDSAAETGARNHSTMYTSLTSNMSGVLSPPDDFNLNRTDNSMLTYDAFGMESSSNYSFEFELWDDNGTEIDNWWANEYLSENDTSWSMDLDMSDLDDGCYELVVMAHNNDTASMDNYSDWFFTMNKPMDSCMWNSGGGTGGGMSLEASSLYDYYDSNDTVQIDWSVDDLYHNTNFSVTIVMYIYDSVEEELIEAWNETTVFAVTDTSVTSYSGTFEDDASNLGQGCFMGSVRLDDIDDETFMPLYEMVEFGIEADCEQEDMGEEVYANGYMFDGNLTAYWSAMNLVKSDANNTIEYRVEYNLFDNDDGMMIDSQNYTWISNTTSDYEDGEFTTYYLDSGCYKIEVFLYDANDGHFFDYDDYMVELSDDCDEGFPEYPQGNASFDLNYVMDDPAYNSSMDCLGGGVGLLNASNADMWDMSDDDPSDYFNWGAMVNLSDAWLNTVDGAIEGSWLIVGGVFCEGDDGEEFTFVGIYGNSSDADDRTMVDLVEGEHYADVIDIYLTLEEDNDDGGLTFVCGNGDEIPFEWVNDETADCDDGSDEQWYDNGTPTDMSDDCQMGSDENCTGAPINWFDCDFEGNETVWIYQVNDGIEDCANGSDEGMGDDEDDMDCLPELTHVFSETEGVHQFTVKMSCAFDEETSEMMIDYMDQNDDGIVDDEEKDAFMDDMLGDDDGDNETMWDEVKLDGNLMTLSTSYEDVETGNDTVTMLVYNIYTLESNDEMSSHYIEANIFADDDDDEDDEDDGSDCAYAYFSADEPWSVTNVTLNFMSGNSTFISDGMAHVCEEPSQMIMNVEDMDYEEGSDGFSCADNSTHVSIHYSAGDAASPEAMVETIFECMFDENNTAEVMANYDWNEDGMLSTNESDDFLFDISENADSEISFALNGVDMGESEFTPAYSFNADGNMMLEQKWTWSLEQTAAEIGMMTSTLVLETDETEDDEGDGSCYTVSVTASEPWYVTDVSVVPATAMTLSDNGDGTYSADGCETPDTVTFDFSQEEIVTDHEPECDLYWSISAVNGSWAENGSEIVTGPDGDGEIQLDAGVHYYVGVYCWDMDGDDITTSWSTAALGGLSNSQTNAGTTWGYVDFVPPAGTPDFSVDYSWSSTDYGGSGTVDVSIKGESPVDPGTDGTDDEDDSSSGDSGGIPGFTGVFAVIAMLGALLFTQRRK